mmetsp:Transcript_2587/g.4707  ORF Transcript_2587/g.4707 Transcript_2587/m.4707 type:complete len:488 (-) Transcript_2587:118-1581(-)
MRSWHPPAPKDEATIMLTEFVCHDDSLMASFGSHSKSVMWRLSPSGYGEPLTIRLQVEKSIMSNAEVLITEDDRTLFPLSGGHEKGTPMTEDFAHRWEVFGIVRGLNEKNVYEVQPPVDDDHEGPVPWYPAVVTKQVNSGSFEVVAFVPDGSSGGIKETMLPAAKCSDIREVHTGSRIHVPWRSIKLNVFRERPTEAVLTVDDGEPITNFLAVPTPAVGDVETQTAVGVYVDKRRSMAIAEVGNSVFSYFLSGEARRVSAEVLHSWGGSKTWTIQLGPFAEHTVLLERFQRTSKIYRLSVDGVRLVEATAEDLRCSVGQWRVDFRFLGERFLNFLVFETSKAGAPLDSQGTVSQQSHVSYTCSVVVPDDRDISTAVLTVDGVDFEGLPAKLQLHQEPNYEAPVHTLQQDFGVHVPYKVNEDARPADPASRLTSMFEKMTGPADMVHMETLESTVTEWLSGFRARLRGIWTECQNPPAQTEEWETATD